MMSEGDVTWDFCEDAAAMRKSGWIGLALCVGMAALTAGCKSSAEARPPELTDEAVAVAGSGPWFAPSAETPVWAQGLGKWIEDWDLRHPEEAGKYMWVVGTSQPIESLEQDALASQTASNDAVFHLMRQLGMDFVAEAKTADRWTTTPGGQLAADLYREALTREMAKYKLNFQEYERHYSRRNVDEVGYTRPVYLLKALYRLDKARFQTQNVLEGALASMTTEIQGRTDLSAADKDKALRTARANVEAARRKMGAAAAAAAPAARPIAAARDLAYPGAPAEPAKAAKQAVSPGAAPAVYAPAKASAGDIEWARPQTPPMWFADLETWLKMNAAAGGSYRVVAGDGATEEEARRMALRNGLAAFGLKESESGRLAEKGTFLRKWREGRRPRMYEISVLYEASREALVWQQPDPAPAWARDFGAWLKANPTAPGERLRVVTGQGATSAAAEEDALDRAAKAFGLHESDKMLLRLLGRVERKWETPGGAGGRFEVTGLYVFIPRPVEEGLKWLVAVYEEKLGRPSGAGLAQDVLCEALSQKRQKVSLWPVAVYKRDVANVERLSQVAGKEAAARVLAGEATADFSSDTDGLICCKGRVTLRVIDVAQGAQVWSKTFESKEFGSSREAAAEKALVSAAKAAAEELKQVVLTR